MFKSVQILFVLGLILNLVACSGGSGDGTKPLQEPVFDYDTKSCNFNLEDGQGAEFGLLDIHDNVPTFFDKEFNQAYFKAIAKANIVSSLEFVNQTGATIYKSASVKSSYCSSPLFAQAQTMPYGIATLWSDLTKDDAKNGSVTLGLYLPQNSRPTASLASSAAIIIRENTSRWTLVHEFMHHLFYLRAAETGYSETQSQAELDRAIEDMQRIAKQRENASAAEMAEAYIRFANGIDTKLLHFTLEEMTIEAYMKDAYNAGTLDYAPKSSNYYIQSSGDKASESYDGVEDLGLKMKDWLEMVGNVKELEGVKSVLSNISARRVTIKSLQNRFSYGAYGLVGIQDGKAAHIGCSHSNEGDKILEQTKVLHRIAPFIPVMSK